MKINESKVEQIAGIVLFVFALLLLLLIIPMQIKDVRAPGVPPRFLPQAISFLIMALSVPLYVGGYKKRNTPDLKEYSITIQELKLVLITLAAVAVTIVLYSFMGFIPTSILLLAFLQYRYGQRKLWKIVLVSIGMPVVLFLFFYYVLMISLPVGIFFN